MYKTKLLHKNLVDGNAYITINDPYKDPNYQSFRNAKKSEKPPFHVEQIPKNSDNHGNFSKIEYKSAGFQEDIKYINKQPLESRKKGFGSHDADRRDEFSSSIRTEQYRETLRKEMAKTGKKSKELEEEIERMRKEIDEEYNHEMSRYKEGNLNATNDSVNFSYDSSVPLFDIGRTRVTQFDPKASKDTFYRFQSEREKRLGSTKPVSYTIGEGSWTVTYKPPQHGGKSEVKNFFDRSHLTVGN